jgi:AcrR family transcriptional regulator
MARPTDETKLLAIKKAAMQVVVEQGISGASISQIAKKAKVSDGYLYRFYKGKRELLEALFLERSQGTYDMLQQQMAVHKTAAELIRAFIVKVFASAANETEAICFYHKLLNDFSFEIPEENRKGIIELCEQILELGKSNGEIRAAITPEQFFAIVIGGTLQFVNIRLRKIFSGSVFTRDDIEQHITTTLKALE